MFIVPSGFRPKPLFFGACVAALAVVLWVSSSAFRPEADGKVPATPVAQDSLRVGIYVVDGCEYIGIGLGTPEGVFTHKGDCSNPIHVR